MNSPTRRAALVAVAVVIVGIAENVLFGQDTPGTRHDISVVFFLAALAGLLALAVIGALALTRRRRNA
jgi:hypothetical protein